MFHSGASYQAVWSGSLWNFIAARVPNAPKTNSATSCAILNGGSVCVGASSLSDDTFMKSWTIQTKTFR